MTINCPSCGETLSIENPVPGKEAQCTKCQKIFTLQAAPQDPAPPPPAAPGATGNEVEIAAANSQGTTALVLGILGFAVCQLCAPFAIIFGLKANNRLKALGAPSNGLATAGFVLGIVGSLILFCFLPIVAAIAIPSFLSARRAASEMSCSGCLKQWGSANEEFRAMDIDGNGEPDYWTGDVAGLYRITVPGDTDPIALIDPTLAGADAAPLASAPEGMTYDPTFRPSGRSRAGHFYRIMKRYEEAGEFHPYDTGTGRHPDRFGICGYPERYNSSGRLVFVLTEDGVLWRKDLGPDRWAEDHPADPNANQWRIVGY
jgi:hypothetical protein